MGGGFLPLIEAFAAFALTMLALATAVSSVLAALQRALRSRGRGMLQMMEYYYRNEVQPFLTVQGLSNAEYETRYTLPAPATAPVAIAREQLLGYGSDARRIAAVTAAAGGTAALDPATGGVTFTPAPAAPPPATAPVPVPAPPQSVTYHVRTDFATAANAVGKPFNTFLVDMTMLPVPRDGDPLAREKLLAYRPPAALPRPLAVAAAWWNRFRLAAHTVEYLTDEEFLARLRASEVGRTVADSRTPAERDLCYDRLRERFRAVGHAATERFVRGARLWTVALGFIMAFAVNIDSTALINRYLQDRSLVASVLANQEKIAEAARDAREQAQQGAATDEKTAATAADLLDRVGDAVDAAMAQMTEAFPVGWNLYPNCGATPAPSRCRQIGPQVCAEAAGILGCVARVAGKDTGGFVRWLLGVILTGVLAGLGAPFWMEVVNNFLRARNLMNNYREAPRGKT